MRRLEIGSGKMPHKDYDTIDIESYAHPDHCGDFRTMNFNDIDEIRSHHLLEHFSRNEALNILDLWHDWLKPGGLLIVETPDFEGICRDFAKDPYWMARHAYGSQEREWAFHRDAWYEAKFKEILPKHGFEILDIKHSFSRKILPNITVTAKRI